MVWSCSTRSLLLWCAHSGAYLGALLRERDAEALFSDLEMPPAAAVPAAVAEREERKHFVDPGKVELVVAPAVRAAGACWHTGTTISKLAQPVLRALVAVQCREALQVVHTQGGIAGGCPTL